MNDFTLLKVIEVGNLLGECILWDDIGQCTWWTDIHNAMLYRYRPADAALEHYALPERLCSFGFIENDERLICAFASGIALYSPFTGQREWLYRPELAYSGTRFNDGRVDRQGRFWSGTMVEGATATDADQREVLGSLYWVSATSHGKTLGAIRISNSLCWSPDAKTVYFADSPCKTINAYDFDTATAAFTNPRAFAVTPGKSAPDGSIIDAQGCLWNAQWGGSSVVRYSPSGEILARLELPVSQPTCMCLGGPELNWLFVSTAREGLDAVQLAAQPEAGNVFVYQAPFKGLRENRFQRNHGSISTGDRL